MSEEDFKELKYSSPKENLEIHELPHHQFDLLINGEKVGAAEIDYFSKPLPLYQVSDLYVDFEHKSRGYASAILAQVERFLIDRKKPGVLVDAIIPGDPASGLYKRRGWKEVPNMMGLYVYNWPEDVSLDVLAGYPFRYTDPMIRINDVRNK